MKCITKNRFCRNRPLVRDLDAVPPAFCSHGRCASFLRKLKKWFSQNGSSRDRLFPKVLMLVFRTSFYFHSYFTMSFSNIAKYLGILKKISDFRVFGVLDFGAVFVPNVAVFGLGSGLKLFLGSVRSYLDPELCETEPRRSISSRFL